MVKTLNLVNPNDPLSFKYEISRFPDGQQSLRLIEDGFETFESLRKNSEIITIASRLNSFLDLEVIICATQALRGVGVKEINLYIPYFLGGRSDRKFSEGGVNYIKDVIAPIINSQNYNAVQVMDPHSDVMEACINNIHKTNNFKLVDDALSYLIGEDEEDQIVLVSPDAGAYKKVFDVAKEFNIENVITASKVRDINNGKILRTEVPSIEKYDDDMKYVIVDDICDGGRTFIELAKAIKEQKPNAKIYLVVTHGIFSYGFDPLVQYFDGIYCTNSVKDNQDGTIVDSFSRHKTIHSFVKQLNVF
jgi:ribose-phosphate pyrophosphokinase